jgi:hypothetical protein
MFGVCAIGDGLPRQSARHSIPACPVTAAMILRWALPPTPHLLPLKYPWMVYMDVNGLFGKVLDGPLTSAEHFGRLEEERRGDGEAQGLGGFE